MSKVNGIYAATLSVLNDDLSLNIKKTINHAENVMELGCHGVVFFGSTGPVSYTHLTLPTSAGG